MAHEKPDDLQCWQNDKPVSQYRIGQAITANTLSDANWLLSADEIVQVQLSLSLFKHVPDWRGATDEQLFEVAQDIINALDKTPRAKR